jgi:signal transduction histidine kinase
MVAAIGGFLGVFYWFVDPRHTLFPFPAAEIHGVVGFLFVCAVLIAFGETNRRKQLQLNRTIVALTSEANERKRAEADLQRAHDDLEYGVKQRTAELYQAMSQLKSEIEVRKQTEERLRQLSVRLMTLQDEERRRLARDLHDSAGQTLSAIKMVSATIQQIGEDRADILKLMHELDSFVDEALQEIRTTSYLLHPPLLDEAGIASAARWFVEGFAKRSGIQAECEIAENLARPPHNHELVLFRVLQESLTNVHRHSGASAAVVGLRSEPGCVRLEVRDNGIGMPQERLSRLLESAGSGVGILGMRERIHELGGRLEIESGPGGTRVMAVLPQKMAASESRRGISAA